MKLWVCGVLSHDGNISGFDGVFSTEEAAVAQCTTLRHFVAPATLDAVVPKVDAPWRGCYLPLDGGRESPNYIPELS